MKKSALVLFFGIFLMSFVSAYYSSSNFSIRDVIDSIAPETIVLLLTFIILFAVISYALGKFFKDNKGIALVVSFAISLLASYGLYKTNLLTNIFIDFSGLFFKIGISEDLFYGILPWVLVIGIIILIWKFGACKILTILGILIIVLGFTDLIYANAITILAGVLCFALGLYFCLRKKKVPNISPNPGPSPNPNPPVNPSIDINRLRKEYNNLYTENMKLKDSTTGGKPKGQIPAKGTSEGNLYSSNLKRMWEITKIAQRNGFSI